MKEGGGAEKRGRKKEKPSVPTPPCVTPGSTAPEPRPSTRTKREKGKEGKKGRGGKKTDTTGSLRHFQKLSIVLPQRKREGEKKKKGGEEKSVNVFLQIRASESVQISVRERAGKLCFRQIRNESGQAPSRGGEEQRKREKKKKKEGKKRREKERRTH